MARKYQPKQKPEAFYGVLYDLISEVMVEQCPVERATPEAAYADAVALVAQVNQQAEDADGYSDYTVGRVDESLCMVMSTANGLLYGCWPFAPSGRRAAAATA